MDRKTNIFDVFSLTMSKEAINLIIKIANKLFTTKINIKPRFKINIRNKIRIRNKHVQKLYPVKLSNNNISIQDF